MDVATRNMAHRNVWIAVLFIEFEGLSSHVVRYGIVLGLGGDKSLVACDQCKMLVEFILADSVYYVCFMYGTKSSGGLFLIERFRSAQFTQCVVDIFLSEINGARQQSSAPR